MTALRLSAMTGVLALASCNSDFKFVGPDGAVYLQANQEYCSLILLAPLSLAPCTYGIRGVVSASTGSGEFASAVSPLAMVTFR